MTETDNSRNVPFESSNQIAAAPLESIVCTQELRNRPSRSPEYETENRALAALARALADSPRTILQTLADKVFEVLNADSAGLSLLTKDEKRFFWAAVAGAWGPHVGAHAPRNFGPCGDVLDHNSPMLFAHWEQRYPYLSWAMPLADEGLLVPFYVNGKAVGTIWAVAHGNHRKFDAEDLRLLESMSRFASAAYQVVHSIEKLKLEVATREKAEAAVRELATGLETQVQARTQELERSTRELLATNKELEKEIAERRLVEERLRQEERELKRSEALLAGEKRLLEMVAGGHSLSGILEALCRLVESAAAGCYCSVVLVDPSGTRLEHGAAPSLPASFITSIIGRPVNVDSGPCAMAAYLNEQVIAGDLTSETRWAAYEWCPMALAHGLRACWSTPIPSTAGKVLGAFAIYYDEPRTPTALHQSLIEQLTHIASIAIERAHSDAALKRSETRKTAILDSALDCIVTIDHEGCITEFNPAAERTFGYRCDQVVGKNLADVIILPPLREQHRRGLARYLETGEARMLGRRVEMTAIRADGSEFPVELAISRIPLDGPPSFTGYLRDITERKQAEEERERLRQAQTDLAHINRVTTMGELTASLAHEIKQPISAAAADAETCLLWLERDQPDLAKAKAAASRLMKDVTHASDIINRIGLLFKKDVPQRELIDVNGVIQEMIALLRSEARRYSISIHSELTNGLPKIMADRVGLQQVFMNLMLNGIEAAKDMATQGKLTIRSQQTESHQLLVSVSDTGVGLRPEQAGQVFDAFYTSKPRGTGMGLPISRSIVESHGGRLWATSNAGPGATFQFTLPINTAAHQTA